MAHLFIREGGPSAFVLDPASESTGAVLGCLAYSDEYRPKDGCIMGPAAHDAGYYQLVRQSPPGAAAVGAGGERRPM